MKNKTMILSKIFIICISLFSCSTSNLSIEDENIPDDKVLVDNISDLRRFSKDTASEVFVLGYYIQSDGGGGLYIADMDDKSSVDNGGTIIVSQEGIRWKLQINEHISPEIFGGGINSIIHAAQAAVENQVELLTLNKVYKVNKEFSSPEGLIWRSKNSTLQQMNLGATVSGFAPASNTTLKGKLTVDMMNPSGGWGDKAHVRIDNFNSTQSQVQHFYFDTIVCVGGHPNCNGVVAAGGANLIRGKRIECGDSHVIGRLFMAHWGNFSQHYRDDSYPGSIYRHKPDYSPTTHPHDIVIDEIVSGTLSLNSTDYQAIALISAGYDIELKKVSGKIMDATRTGRGLVILTPGDLGFAYALPEEKKNKMCNIKIGEVSGFTNVLGVALIDIALYWDKDEKANDKEIYYAGIQDSIGTIFCQGSANSISNNAYNGSNGKGKTRIDKIVGINMQSVYSSRNNTSDVWIKEIYAENCRQNAVIIAGAGGNSAEFPRNVSIDEITLDGYGMDASDNVLGYGVRNRKTINTSIGKIIMEKQGNGYKIMEDDSSEGGNRATVGEIILKGDYRYDNNIDVKQ